MANYFQHPYCSNSALSALGQELGILPQLPGNKYEAYRMGSLFDAVITEPDLLDLIQKKILGTDYSFTRAEYETCLRMRMALNQNPTYQAFAKCNPDVQKEVYTPNYSFEYEGFKFKLNMRGKLDFFISGLVSDLKSTACTSQRSFEEACIQFGYWRQMVLYCGLTDAKKAIIFGVSKTAPHKVFIVTMKPSDALWKRGGEQLNYLAFKYYMTNAAA